MKLPQQLFKEKDPDGYARFMSHAKNIDIGRTRLLTNEGVIATKDSHEIILAYTDMVNKLTSNNYFDPNGSEGENNSGIQDVYNENYIEAIVYASVIEGTNKKLYGIFSAFLARFGNIKVMARLAMRFLDYSKNTNDTELYNEILSSGIAPILKEKYPDVVTMAASNFKLDPSLGEQKYLNLADSLLTNMENLSENWNSDNEFLSVANTDFNPDIKSLIEVNVLNNDTDFTDNTSDEAFLLTALEIMETTNG